MQDEIKKQLRVVDLAGMAVVAAVIAGTMLLGVIPLYKEGMANISEAGRLKGQLTSLEGLGLTLAKMEQDHKQTEGRLLAVEKRLPSPSDANLFIRELAGVTEATGIQVEGTTYPKELKDAGGYKSLPVEVVGTGSWDACYRFLAKLRTMNRVTQLDTVQLDLNRDANAQASAGQTCRMTLNFSTYFMAR